MLPSFTEILQSNKYHIKWTSCSDLPCKLYEASVAVSAAGDTVYAAAGSAADHQTKYNVYCYNTNTDHWTVLPQPGHRSGVLHMLDDRLTIFGGEDPATNEVFKKVTTYISDTNIWYSYYPDMLNKRFKPGVVTCRNYVIVMGGQVNRDSEHDSIEVMDYHYHLQWKILSLKLPVPMWDIKPTISGDNITIVGYSQARTHINAHYQIAIEGIMSSLDQPLSPGVVIKQWKKLSPSPYWNTATLPNSNPPVLIGGGSRDGDILASDIILYDTSRNLWRKIDSLTSARQFVGVALLTNNTIIIIGGTKGGKGVEANKASSLTTVEIGTIVPNQ